jgi:murein DD-endopeptidase MepM/ murein hydrolase activator NlpD
METAAMLIKAAAVTLTDEDTRKRLGWLIAALLSPVILIAVLLCSLGSGSADHNASVVQLCFQGGEIPDSVPEEYRAYIEDMIQSFALLDDRMDEINSQMEDDDSLDAVRVKAIFYALYFGEDSPSRRAHRQYVDCFVTYEERTRTVTTEDDDGNEVESEESYTVAVPVTDLAAVYDNISSTLGLEITDEQKSNADSIYSLIQYGWSSGSAWAGELDGAVMSVDGFCAPLGSGWRSNVTSEFGYRICPYHGRELHSGLDISASAGTPIRAALSGTVVKSCYSSSYGNYTVVDHGNGMTTAYAHQSQRLVQVGDTVEAGQVIGLVGSTGNATTSRYESTWNCKTHEIIYRRREAHNGENRTDCEH